MANRDKFKAELARHIQEKGLSKAELAKKLGCAAPLIGYYLQGERVPRLNQVMRLASVLELEGADREVLFSSAGFRKPKSPGEALKFLSQLVRGTNAGRGVLRVIGTRLLDYLNKHLLRDGVTVEEKEKLTEHLNAILAELNGDFATTGQVKYCAIPVAGWESERLSHSVTALLVRGCLAEAKAAGLTHFIVVIAATQNPGVSDAIKKHEKVENLQFVVQEEARGFGDAIRTAGETLKERVPMVVMTSDDQEIETDCLQKMLDIYSRHHRPVTVVRKSEKGDEGKYGMAQVSWGRQGEPGTVNDMVEKPKSQSRDFSWRLVGRYVLTPECLIALRALKPNVETKKVELTDAFVALLKKKEKVFAHKISAEPTSLSDLFRGVRNKLESLERLNIARS